MGRKNQNLSLSMSEKAALEINPAVKENQEGTARDDRRNDNSKYAVV